MDQALLKAVNQQVLDRLSRSSKAPPWVWFRLMKLKEALGDVMVDLDSPTSQKATRPRLAQQRETHLQLVETGNLQDNAQHRRVDEKERKPK